MRDSVVLHQVKPGIKLVGKPTIKVTTVIPPGYDKDSIDSLAAAATAWRRRGKA